MYKLISTVKASSFPCGRLGTLYFPLTNNPACSTGLYVKGCDEENNNDDVPAASSTDQAIRIENNDKKITYWFDIESIYSSVGGSKMIVRDNGIRSLLSYLYTDYGDCIVGDLHNVTLPPPSPILTFYMEMDQTLTLYKCHHNNTVNHTTTHDALPASYLNRLNLTYSECDEFLLYYGLPKPVYQDDASNSHSPSALSGCQVFQIPTQLQNHGKPNLDQQNFGEYNFLLSVSLSPDCRKCIRERGGACQLDDKQNFLCLSKPADIEHTPSTEHTYAEHEFVKVLTVAIAASAAMVVMLMVLRCCFGRKVTSTSIFFWKGENPTYKDIEMFLKGHELHLTKRYTYSEIREMTNSFANKLGHGGYGTVYKGKLSDGRLVAVKVLKKLKGNGEEFINEVKCISQTSHVNIVSLFGFCFQGSKRALIYEFMPNGSLEKFVYEDNVAMVDLQLDCQTLHNIAIGTARGLEYLHKGCNTRILHFDIKPHNILLDADFCPKISDFGLSKVCPRKESIVSIFGARGTVGYIAPEVFSRNFGGVSHKSDVYSFGMMVFEMVGGRKNMNVEVEGSSEIYFPHWIYKCLEKNQELALRCVKNENDNEIIRKMILVSLWCIQTDPSARPPMSRVVEMLEGSLESLHIPPQPFLSSSPKSLPTHYSTSNISD